MSLNDVSLPDSTTNGGGGGGARCDSDGKYERRCADNETREKQRVPDRVSPCRMYRSTESSDDDSSPCGRRGTETRWHDRAVYSARQSVDELVLNDRRAAGKPAYDEKKYPCANTRSPSSVDPVERIIEDGLTGNIRFELSVCGGDRGRRQWTDDHFGGTAEACCDSRGRHADGRKHRLRRRRDSLSENECRETDGGRSGGETRRSYLLRCVERRQRALLSERRCASSRDDVHEQRRRNRENANREISRLRERMEEKQLKRRCRRLSRGACDRREAMTTPPPQRPPPPAARCRSDGCRKAQLPATCQPAMADSPWRCPRRKITTHDVVTSDEDNDDEDEHRPFLRSDASRRRVSTGRTKPVTCHLPSPPPPPTTSWSSSSSPSYESFCDGCRRDWRTSTPIDEQGCSRRAPVDLSLSPSPPVQCNCDVAASEERLSEDGLSDTKMSIREEDQKDDNGRSCDQ